MTLKDVSIFLGMRLGKGSRLFRKAATSEPLEQWVKDLLRSQPGTVCQLRQTLPDCEGKQPSKPRQQ